MPLLELVPEFQKIKILEAYRSTLCDDYCVEDNCLRCNEKRLEESLPFLVEILVLNLRERWYKTEELVRDGLKHRDALQILTDILSDLGSPPKRNPRI